MRTSLKIGNAHASGFLAVCALTLIKYAEARAKRPRLIPLFSMAFLLLLVGSSYPH